MHDKVKTVEVDGAQYEVRRMTPAVGSYIWQKLMAACYKAGESAKDSTQPEEGRVEKLLPTPTAEERLRALCGVAFMFMDFETFLFVQASAMKVLSRHEGPAGFIPVMTDDGRWSVNELSDSPMLVTRLAVEALVFNLHSFLA